MTDNIINSITNLNMNSHHTEFEWVIKNWDVLLMVDDDTLYSPEFSCAEGGALQYKLGLRYVSKDTCIKVKIVESENSLKCSPIFDKICISVRSPIQKRSPKNDIDDDDDDDVPSQKNNDEPLCTISFDPKSESIHEWKTLTKSSELCRDSYLVVLCVIRISKPEEESCDSNTTALIKQDKYMEYFNAGTLADITLKINEKLIKAHKVILAANSSVFLKMFLSGNTINDEIVIRDFNYETIHALILFMYSGKVDNYQNIVLDLIIAADHYNMLQLKCLCEVIIIKMLNVEQFYQIYIVGEESNSRNIKCAAINFYKKFWQKITTASNNWIRLGGSDARCLNLFDHL